MTERISRREFLKLAGVGAGGALLTACGVIPSEPLPTQQPLPSEIPSPTPTTEASPTPETAVTPEAPVYEAGTVVLNPEYDLNGRIEVIPENAQAFYDYFLDTLIMTNPEYFEQLTTQDGTAISDSTALRRYLEENQRLLPPGLRLVSRWGRGGLYATLTAPLELPLSLERLAIDFIDYDEYQRIVLDYTAPEPYVRSYFLLEPCLYNDVGIIPHTEGDHHVLSLQVVNIGQNSRSGFPQGTEDTLSESEVEFLDNHLRFILYLFRSISIEPPSEIIRNWMSKGIEIDQSQVLQGRARMIRNLDQFFGELENSSFSDAPPQILQISP